LPRDLRDRLNVKPCQGIRMTRANSSRALSAFAGLALLSAASFACAANGSPTVDPTLELRVDATETLATRSHRDFVVEPHQGVKAVHFSLWRAGQMAPLKMKADQTQYDNSAKIVVKTALNGANVALFPPSEKAVNIRTFGAHLVGKTVEVSFVASPAGEAFPQPGDYAALAAKILGGLLLGAALLKMAPKLATGSLGGLQALREARRSLAIKQSSKKAGARMG